MLFVLAGVSFAYWGTTDSSHPAMAAAGTLSAPTGGAQQGDGKPGSVPVSWTAPAGYPPTGYTVLRCTGSGCTNFAPITNGHCSGTISATSCTDTDSTLAVGTTYSYEVQAQFDNWVSAAGSPFTAATSAVTSLTFTSQPASGQNIQATGTGTFAVSVAIQDAKGVVATNDNADTVTLAIASGANPGGGTLTCTGGLTATASSGVASFTGCATKTEQRRFIASCQMFTNIICSPTRTRCESFRPLAAGIRAMGHPCHGRACPGHDGISARRTPESEQQGESFAIARPRQYETCFCGGIMDGRDKPRHDAPRACCISVELMAVALPPPLAGAGRGGGSP